MFLHGAGRDNYVNAVYVAGYRRPDGFIATEAPLPGRHSIFWQMVAQKHSQTIVVLNNLPADEVRVTLHQCKLIGYRVDWL